MGSSGIGRNWSKPNLSEADLQYSEDIRIDAIHYKSTLSRDVAGVDFVFERIY